MLVAVAGMALCLSGGNALSGVRAREALEALERDKGPAVVTNVVGMVGFNGDDQPETWRLLVRDETTPEVLTEYIISGGKVTGQNSIPKTSATDLPEKPLIDAVWRVDSAEAYRIADDEAILAGISFVRLNYQLRFRGADPAPTWLLTFLDATGEDQGQVVIDAADGTIPFRNFPGTAAVAQPSAPGPEPASDSVPPGTTPVAAPPSTTMTAARGAEYSSRPVRFRNLFTGPRRRQGNSR